MLSSRGRALWHRAATRPLRRARHSSAAAYPTTGDGHPLVDCHPLLTASSPAARAEAVSHLGAALRHRGFFYAANVSALPGTYLREVYDFAQRAHALPASVKHAYRQRGGLGSYSGSDVGEPELRYDPGAAAATVRGWDYSRSRFTIASSQGDGGASRYPPASVLAPSYAETRSTRRQDAFGATPCQADTHVSTWQVRRDARRALRAAGRARPRAARRPGGGAPHGARRAAVALRGWRLRHHPAARLPRPGQRAYFVRCASS